MIKEEILEETLSFYSSIASLLKRERFTWMKDLLDEGLVKMGDLERVTGYTRQRLYQIFDEIEKS